jgi:hypothetical protein
VEIFFTDIQKLQASNIFIADFGCTNSMMHLRRGEGVIGIIVEGISVIL